MTDQEPAGNTDLTLEQQNQLVSSADELLDQVLDRLRKADENIWVHQAEMGRTVITLAAGGIVVSVSVVQLLLGKVPHPVGLWLLPASWITWTLTILAGISRESWMSTARATGSYLERKRGFLRQQIRALKTTNTIDDYEAIIVGGLNEADKDPSKAVKVLAALNQVVYWTFAAGIASLVGFAIRNLPF